MEAEIFILTSKLENCINVTLLPLLLLKGTIPRAGLIRAYSCLMP